jgi:hypothetical protein
LETQLRTEGQSISTPDSQGNDPTQPAIQDPSQDPTLVPEPQPAPGEVRSQLLGSVAKQREQPSLAETVYQSLGMNVPGVALVGNRAHMTDLKPGDLVGWNGGQEADGRYIGNIAVYAGNGEIIEKFYGTNRRRKLTPQENTFGMPVILPGTSSETQLPTPEGM